MIEAALAAAAALLATLPADARPGPGADASLRAYLQQRFAAERQDAPNARYVAASADLNGDGRPEALVYLLSSSYCGTGGCNLLVLTPAGRGWRQVADMTVVNPPVRLLDTRSHGWRDLAVRVAGGGSRAHDARLSFDGRRYPPNPSVAPAQPIRGRAAGRLLIRDEDRGSPLF
jgi:hypothetical protein